MDDTHASARESLTILIAEDSSSDRLILKTLLQRMGHQVLEAADGVEAVAIYRESGPDIVLLDALMPRMDGMETARRIKELAGERLVPLIFLTSLSDPQSLARCLEAGGDDFLTKPYSRVIIEAKLNAFNRMRLMHRTLSQQRDLINEHNRRLLEEQMLAKRVFDNIAHTGCLDAPNIRYHASPMALFSGDVLFACPRPAGGMHVFIGDFTGHGLPAAVGAMPVAEIFYGMTSKGFSGCDVLREINQKLGRILPRGTFCCAALVQADFDMNQLRVWNGGLPDGFLIRPDGRQTVIRASHLPLGVVGTAGFDATMEVFHTSPGDTLLLLTDGVLEAENSQGEMFGEARLQETLDCINAGQLPLESVMDAVREFIGNQKERDDLTLVSLQMESGDALAQITGDFPRATLEGPAEWHCVYEIGDRTLAQFSPLPLLLHICMEVPGLRRKSGEIYTLLAELYNNALEHGILKLPSEWKHSLDGFSQYYQERQRRLAGISGHHIRFSLTHRLTASGGELTVICEDSGEGFDFDSEPAPGDMSARYAGRGLELLQELGDSVTFREKGNHVEIVYCWNSPGLGPVGAE